MMERRYSCSPLGMELFEEALRRWEQALTFRNRQVEDEANCGSIKLGAGDAIAEESVEVSIFNVLDTAAALTVRCVLLPESFQFLIQIPKLRMNSNFQFSGIAFKGYLALFLLILLVGYLEEGGVSELVLLIFWQLLLYQCLLLGGIIKLISIVVLCSKSLGSSLSLIIM